MAESIKIMDVIESLKEYYNTNYELRKLEATERFSVLGAGLLSTILIGVVALIFGFFISLLAGLYFSDFFDNIYIGFGIVAGFYLLLGLILIIGRKKLLESPMCDKIIRKILSGKSK